MQTLVLLRALGHLYTALLVALTALLEYFNLFSNIA